jgi:REase_DpnII-MboI
MTRKSLGQRELVEQLIVDKAQYQRHPDCSTLVCFVYDPARRLPRRQPLCCPALPERGQGSG